MRTLIYKRTHHGDPDPRTGEFGCNDCMGSVRGWRFNAVVGIGGIGAEPKRNGIAGRLTWIGIGPQKSGVAKRRESPRLTFQHFWYRGADGPLLAQMYPILARRMYDKNVRVYMHYAPTNPELDREIDEILGLAMDAPPSGQSAGGDLQHPSHKCASKSGC
jgi:hypothetical protein